MPIVKSSPWAQQDAINVSLYNRTITGVNRFIVSGELGSISGTVTNLVAGSNIVLVPSPITTTGSIGLTNTVNVETKLTVGASTNVSTKAYVNTDTATWNYIAESSTNQGGGLDLWRYRGTSAAKTAVSGGDTLATMGFRGYTLNGDYSSLPAEIVAVVDGQVTGATVPGRISLITQDSTGTTNYRIVATSVGTELFGNTQISGATLLYGPQHQGSPIGPNRYVTSGELSGGAGSVTSLVAGSNVILDPSPITTTGTIGLAPNIVVQGIQVSGVLQVYSPDGVGIIQIGTPSPDIALMRMTGNSASLEINGTSTASEPALHWLTSGTGRYATWYGLAAQGRGLITHRYSPAGPAMDVYCIYDTGGISFLDTVQVQGNLQTSGITLAYRPIFHQAQTGPNRYVTSGELTAGGSGTITNIALGSNLAMQPSPITTTGSIGLANSLNIPGDMQISGTEIIYTRLGVGQSPSYLLHVHSDAGTTEADVETSRVAGGVFGLRRYRGTTSAPTMVSGDDALGQVLFYGYDALGAYTNYAARILCVVDGPVTSNFVPARIAFQVTDLSGIARERFAMLPAGSRITGNTQVSGTMLHYDPIYHRDQTGANRYLPSGELAGARKRVSTQFDATTATIADIPDLSVPVNAGESYEFRAALHVNADGTGGSRYSISGTATASAYVAELTLISNTGAPGTLAVATRHSLLGQMTSEIGTTAGYAQLRGLITVNTSGTLVPYFAQSTANGTSSVMVGSTFTVDPVP